MLHRLIAAEVEAYLERSKEKSSPILLIDGARQVGKTYLVRHVGRRLFKNFIEVNLISDAVGDRLFADVKTVKEFYFALSIRAGKELTRGALVFLDEIQVYPQLLTLLKFLREDARFVYVASGSELGVALSQTTSIPMGSITLKHMYPLGFEEFLLANGVGEAFIEELRDAFNRHQTLPETIHEKMMDFLKHYLICGGLPKAVNTMVEEQNFQRLREIQRQTIAFYAADASQYDQRDRLKIRRIYEMIPSNLEMRKKRIRMQDIESKRGKTYSDYVDAFDYLISAGIALQVKAVSEPQFPLVQSSTKTLLKLYMNDVGLLSSVLFPANPKPILDGLQGINHGALYESFVAQELHLHGYPLFYYDNKARGEIDFLIDDEAHATILPIEVKSGRDYTIHSAIDRLLEDAVNGVSEGVVFSNERTITTKNGLTYLPIYMVMFLESITF